MPRQFPLMPEPASTFAGPMDTLIFVLVILTLIFTGLVACMILIFALRYRQGRVVDRSRPVDTDHRLELAWTIIPLFLGLGVFVWGAKLFADMRQPPANATEIFVIGKQWMWHLQHANGIRENNELHVPLGQPIKLTMISQDVIHDFFVPAFRTHQDVIPGHYTTTWFEPTRVGKYHLFCAQYCGTDHSRMVGWVYVMPPAEYEAWLNSGGTQAVTAPQSMESLGETLYNQLGCESCHTDVDTVHGPSLMGIYSKPRKLTTGQTVTADDEYLRESLVNPYAKIVAGYDKTMPEYKVGPASGQLSEEKVLELIAYIKSMGPGAASNARTAAGGQQPSPGAGTASGGTSTTSGKRQ